MAGKRGECGVARTLIELGELPHRAIEPCHVAAFLREQRAEGRHQFFVRGHRRELRIVDAVLDTIGRSPTSRPTAPS